MRTKSHDIPQIQTQLTLIRWYLNAAAGTSQEAVRHKIQQARELYETAACSLSYLNLSAEQRESIERELSALRSQLETAGDG
jgi:hypothetical protein